MLQGQPQWMYRDWKQPWGKGADAMLQLADATSEQIFKVVRASAVEG